MIDCTAGRCEADAISVHYLRTGGHKPPLILLHGLMGSGACWTPLARALCREFDVVMPDARGHGKSSAPSRGYRYEDLAGDVIALIRELGLSAPILLGHSMGGMTAAVAANLVGDAVRGVVLVDPTFISPEWQREVYESDIVEQHRRLLRQNMDDVMAQALSQHPNRSPEISELWARARLQTRLRAFDVLRPPNPDYHRLVSNIDVPILLVIGDSGVVSLETAQELRALNPRIRIELVHDAGHGIPYDQPERFEAALRPFLREVVV